ncbi:hypothetical protein [Psychrobacter urativorans]|uniref:hypothetical protein n=1 Tax=Psychrobacter urativorans TaxID=45610 RepID=UPI002233E410|nr:hypothetical protein [Psychrobacter urativorans]
MSAKRSLKSSLAVKNKNAITVYAYIKTFNTYPSAGGRVVYLHKAYGDRLLTGFNILLMDFFMVIAQSFLA